MSLPDPHHSDPWPISRVGRLAVLGAELDQVAAGLQSATPRPVWRRLVDVPAAPRRLDLLNAC